MPQVCREEKKQYADHAECADREIIELLYLRKCSVMTLSTVEVFAVLHANTNEAPPQTDEVYQLARVV